MMDDDKLKVGELVVRLEHPNETGVVVKIDYGTGDGDYGNAAIDFYIYWFQHQVCGWWFYPGAISRLKIDG